ncbi:MAG: radical SAM protein [Bacteroidales bacterium]|nr:radical SAM protein [Bacteroidales bacterium]
MEHITLNPLYVLKPDEGRALIMATIVGRNSLGEFNDSFSNIIHPIYAMILSYIDGREFQECISEAADELGVSYELVEGFVNGLLNKSEQIYIKNGELTSAFPPNTIISIPEKNIQKRYDSKLFVYDKIDLRMKRHLTPSTITLMLNNVCVTDCVYCYQDKTQKVNCGISLERILEIIHEAHELHVNTFDVVGGEFFLYPHWKEVLKELRKYGYHPYLSTKKPLPECDVKYLADLKIHDIQISLDSIIEEHLIDSLGVKSGYLDEMLNTLALCDKYQIPVMVHSVLTKCNNSIEDMESIYNKLRELKCIVDWHVVKGEPTLYPRIDYSEIEIEPKALNDIVDYLSELKKISDIPIRIPEKVFVGDEMYGVNNANSPNRFFQRAFCSGLFSSLYILPDGKVTICEQLYWNKNFIVGDVLSESIIEIWNSEKAKALFFIRQDDIPEDSQCHNCDNFETCRSIRQVCYREIIKKYGQDKWYYPDINCPFVEQK